MTEQSKVWLNGKLIPCGKRRYDFVTWFLKGSAIFEVLGTYADPENYAFRLDEHLKRLMKSAELLGMETRTQRKRLEPSKRLFAKIASAVD